MLPGGCATVRCATAVVLMLQLMMFGSDIETACSVSTLHTESSTTLSYGHIHPMSYRYGYIHIDLLLHIHLRIELEITIEIRGKSASTCRTKSSRSKLCKTLAWYRIMLNMIFFLYGNLKWYERQSSQ